MLPEYFEFSLPTKVVYGAGILGNIADSVAPLGKRRALLVVTNSSIRSGAVEKLKEGLACTEITIAAEFTEVPPDSNVEAVEACAKAGTDAGCDLVIAMGGGSVLDTAKVANLLMAKGGKLQDHMGAFLLGNDSILPHIMIPTTSGTGSEVTKVAVIADPANDVKLPFAENQFLPDLAILDPECSKTMPGKLTAATGMDAMTHAIEAYVDKEWSPATDALALHVIRMVSQNILVACAHPEDLQARGGMAVASCLAGVAFSHSMVGMVHGISHALGGIYHIPHGLANALVLPEVMEYNLDCQSERYADIAEALGVAYPRPVLTLRSICETWWMRRTARLLRKLNWIDVWFRRRAARAGVIRIRNLNRQLASITGMPLNLKDAGIKDDLARIEQLADTAMEDGSMIYNPREPERAAVIDIVTRLHNARPSPLKVKDDELRPAGAQAERSEVKDVFNDEAMVYDVLGGFFEQLAENAGLAKALLATNLCVQFIFRKPESKIVLDASGDTPEILFGDDFVGQPDVSMTMDADIAHFFWHGKVNLVSAITRRQIVAKGAVSKTTKLLPILKPAFELYPEFLRERGLHAVIVT